MSEVDQLYEVLGRRGRRTAMVALARKVGGGLFAILRDGSAYDPLKLGGVGVARAEHAA